MRVVSLALLATGVAGEMCVEEDDRTGLLQSAVEMDTKLPQALLKNLAATELAGGSHKVDSVTSGSRGSVSTEAAGLPFWKWTWDKKKPFSENLFVNYDRYIAGAILTIVVQMALGMLIWTSCEWGRPVSLPFTEDPGSTFQTQRFGCFRTPRLCCFSLWCPGIQWAENMSTAGILTFWVAIMVFFAAAVMNALLLNGEGCYGLCTALLIVVFRQRVREQLGLTAWTCTGCLGDILYVFFCPCASITQEAQVLRLQQQTKTAAPGNPVVVATGKLSPATAHPQAAQRAAVQAPSPISGAQGH